MDCIFCKIIAGELPSTKVYEDDRCIAILDITPVNAGHTLILPKEHYADITQTPADVACHLITVAQKLGPAIMAAVGATGFNTTMNTGSAAGQTVFHTHVHLIPRHENDNHAPWQGKAAYQEGEAAAIAAAIRERL